MIISPADFTTSLYHDFVTLHLSPSLLNGNSSNNPKLQFHLHFIIREKMESYHVGSIIVHPSRSKKLIFSTAKYKDVSIQPDLLEESIKRLDAAGTQYSKALLLFFHLSAYIPSLPWTNTTQESVESRLYVHDRVIM